MNVHDYQFLYVDEGSSIGYYVIMEPWRLSFLGPLQGDEALCAQPGTPGPRQALSKVCDYCMDTLGPSNDYLNEMFNSNTRPAMNE